MVVASTREVWWWLAQGRYGGRLHEWTARRLALTVYHCIKRDLPSLECLHSNAAGEGVVTHTHTQYPTCTYSVSVSFLGGAGFPLKLLLSLEFLSVGETLSLLDPMLNLEWGNRGSKLVFLIHHPGCGGQGLFFLSRPITGIDQNS